MFPSPTNSQIHESEITLLMDEILHHQLRKDSPYQLVQNFSII